MKRALSASLTVSRKILPFAEKGGAFAGKSVFSTGAVDYERVEYQPLTDNG